MSSGERLAEKGKSPENLVKKEGIFARRGPELSHEEENKEKGGSFFIVAVTPEKSTNRYPEQIPRSQQRGENVPEGSHSEKSRLEKKKDPRAALEKIQGEKKQKRRAQITRDVMGEDAKLCSLVGLGGDRQQLVVLYEGRTSFARICETGNRF